jgi:hypothetical protein
MAISVAGPKKGKSVGADTSGREFVLGSRPPDVYSPRIKPLAGQTQYGKSADPARQSNLSGVTSGTTNRPGF